MAQRTLFDHAPQSDPSGMVPASRRTDPETSKLAAKKATESAASDRALILSELRREDGQTAGEIAAHLGHGWDNVRVSRRTTELERSGKIVRGRPRICSIRGNQMVEWRLK